MKLLALSILLIITLASEISIKNTDPTTVTCSDGLPPGPRADDSTNCYCKCTTPDVSTLECVTQSTLEDARAAMESKQPTDSERIVATEFMVYCRGANPALGTCKGLTTESLGTTCDCPICDETEICSAYSKQTTPEYKCSRQTCYPVNCETVSQDGNLIATFTLDSTETDQANCKARDGTTGCTTVEDPVDPIDPRPDPCLSGHSIVIGEDGCFRECIADDSTGPRTDDTKTLDGARLSADTTTIDTVRDEYEIRNPPLKWCPVNAILPRDDGCGFVCIHRCTDAERKGIVIRDDVTGKCRKKLCVEKDEVVEFVDDSQNTERYANILKEFTEGEEFDCKTLFEERDTDKERETEEGKDETTICNDPCAYDHREPVCISFTDGDSTITRTFDCAREAICVAGGLDKVVRKRPGRCKSPTEDECSLGDIEVTDEYVPNDKCPRIRCCVANDDGRKIMRPGAIRNAFPNLRTKCAERLDKVGCTGNSLFFDTCPSKDDTIEELCDKLYCDPDRDPNDVDDGSVCRVSAEKMETEPAIKTDDGCNVETCANTFDALDKCRYDENIDNCERLLNICPKLGDCRTSEVDTAGGCGQCPTCLDDVDNDVACGRNTFRRKTRACIEKPEEDPTAPADPEGRVRLTDIGFRMCINDFGEFTRTDIYGFIRRAVLAICEECNIEIETLRAYVRAFDYEVVVGEDTDPCDVMVAIKVTVEVTDINKERLIALIKCLKGFTLDEVLVKIRAALTDTTRGEKLAEVDDENEVGVTTEGVETGNSAAATLGTDIDLYDGEGNAILEYETADPSTTVEGRGNGVGRWVIIGGVLASFVAVLF